MLTHDRTGVVSVPGKIRVLPGEIVARIAAGEVVERPAAIVKELIENSLDAGAQKISVDIQDGGVRSIRVTDDGEGMSRPDVILAFQRHATSKLRSDHELFSIHTLGFRGEALPSIASVSKVKVITQCGVEPVGTQLHLTGGHTDMVEDVAASAGTQIQVTDLFFNTPARKKFLKTATTEFSHISHVVQQTSLAWPGVHFRLAHHSQQVLDFPAVSSRRDRVLQVYRRRFLTQCREVAGHQEGFHLVGFIIDPVHARSGRVPQDLFINQRPVKSPTVAHAVYDAYGAFLAKGRHPLYVLFVDLNPDRVDVNVHPTKREVRFLHQDVIHGEVRRAVREVLGDPSAGSRSAGLSGIVAGVAGTPEGQVTSLKRARGEPVTKYEVADRRAHEPITSEQGRLTLPSGSGQRLPGDTVHEPWVTYSESLAEEVVPLGQVQSTFLVAQVGSELHVVDQHTAHERVVFERLLRGWGAKEVAVQPLLIPEPIDLPAHHAVVLEQHLPDLEKVGVVMESFGTSSFVIRAVPSVLGQTNYSALVLDLIEDLLQWNSLASFEARMRPILATLACHSAVRAGRSMELPEIKHLLEDWVAEGLPMTCPHGRRVALRLSTEELAKIFARA